MHVQSQWQKRRGGFNALRYAFLAYAPCEARASPPLLWQQTERGLPPFRVLTPLDYPSHLGAYSLANLPRDGLGQRQREH